MRIVHINCKFIISNLGWKDDYQEFYVGIITTQKMEVFH